MKRTRLKRFGTRATKEQEALGAFRNALKARGACEVGWEGCLGTASHAHHILPRSRGGKHEEDNGAWVCSRCHDLIHRSPKRARLAGWTR